MLFLFKCALLRFTLFQPLLRVTFIEPPAFTAPIIFDTQYAMQFIAKLPLWIEPLHIVALEITLTDLLLQAFVKEKIRGLSFTCSCDDWRLIIVQETLFLIV